MRSIQMLWMSWCRDEDDAVHRSIVCAFASRRPCTMHDILSALPTGSSALRAYLRAVYGQVGEASCMGLAHG